MYVCMYVCIQTYTPEALEAKVKALDRRDGRASKVQRSKTSRSAGMGPSYAEPLRRKRPVEYCRGLDSSQMDLKLILVIVEAPALFGVSLYGASGVFKSSLHRLDRDHLSTILVVI